MKQTRQKNRPPVFNSKLFYAFLFLFSTLLLFSPVYFKFDLKTLTSLGIIGVALLNFISSSTLFFPVPGFLATGVGGSLYNPLLVAIASSIGSTLGESVGFVFGHASRKITHPKDHTFMESIYKIIHHKHGGWLIIVLAFIPNPFFDAIGIVAGLALYPLRKFLALVFIGRFARDLIVAFIGANIG